MLVILLTSGYSNVFLGTKAGGNHTSGNYNVAIGQCANASGTTTGQHNVFVGCGAGDCVTSGCDNVYLGRGAGNDVTTARCNIALGFYAGSSNQLEFIIFSLVIMLVEVVHQEIIISILDKDRDFVMLVDVIIIS